MKNIIFSLIIFYTTINGQKAFSFDEKKLQADLDYIEAHFISEDENSSILNSKNEVIAKPLANQEILDLETEYFDEVKSKKAALKKRSR